MTTKNGEVDPFQAVMAVFNSRLTVIYSGKIFKEPT